ncbi:hypothetical protein SRABI96_03890 [Peribacillus sp. Bi96]|nr:hypothetical protein SRABI96_03890 [Peribacillus sp. Bi96]
MKLYAGEGDVLGTSPVFSVQKKTPKSGSIDDVHD